jgi:hypothetical protein
MHYFCSIRNWIGLMKSCLDNRNASGSIGLTACHWAAVILLVCLIGRPASAVIISSGNGQTGIDPSNTLTGNVGYSSTGNASVTYLGNDWAITANHVYTGSPATLTSPEVPANVSIGGNSYPVDEASTTQLKNADSSYADLKLIHIETGGANPAAPALPTLQVASSSLALGATVEMVGNGQNLNVDESGSPVQYYWNVTGDPMSPTWTQTYATMDNPQPGNYSGYETLDSNTIRYGENDVATVTAPAPFYDGTDYNTSMFLTQFNNSYYTGGTVYPDEAQATSGDSGGAVFSYIGGQWVLAGIMVAEGVFVNQPTNVSPTVASGNGTAVFGDASYIADLSVYQSQILAVVPEPSSLVLVALGSLGLLFAAVLRRHRRACKPDGDLA